MAITNAQQARQMYKEGSEKPVTQAGVKNFLGKQEMVKAPKFWLSEPGHVKAKLAYITDEEEKILIDKNLYGSLKVNLIKDLRDFLVFKVEILVLKMQELEIHKVEVIKVILVKVEI